jgi:hypothetical protein
MSIGHIHLLIALIFINILIARLLFAGLLDVTNQLDEAGCSANQRWKPLS